MAGPHSDNPSEIGTEAAPKAPAGVLRVRAVDLEVTAGSDTGRRARVDRTTFVIGTGPGADLRLTDPTVSREHLRLSLTPDGLHVRDDGSKNGTWLGGARIAEATLSADTVLALGTTRLGVHLESVCLELPLSASASFGKAFGVSAPMRHLFSLLERVSASDVTILLEGESGVGKELLARAIHQSSPRAGGPFVAVDCGAIPAGLVEAELFGHLRGAYTGATDDREGVFQQADGGTLFLDEIGELPLDLQPKLLRVLEQREVRPLGGRTVRPVDVRVVAATNRRLAEAAHKEEFRRDLFYRLSVARVTVPPLRDRTEDIVPLAQRFLCTALRDPAAALPEDLGAMLRAYTWPGNVRELRNAVERYAFLGARDAKALFDIPVAASVEADELASLPFHEARRRVLDRFEGEYLPRVLERAGGVVARAAELAEVARPSLYRMLERRRLAADKDE